MQANPKRILLRLSHPQLIPPTNNLRSPLDIPLAATIWQTSAASFEYQQITVQVLAVDEPTQLPQRAFAHVLRLAVFLGQGRYQVRLANRQGRQTSSRQTSFQGVFVRVSPGCYSEIPRSRET
jgi:hypothetical protein